MFGKGGSGLETDLRNWARKMGIMPDGNASDIIRKLCTSERRPIFERVIREIRPICEVEHIRKNLALRRMSQKHHLTQKLEEKEKEICIRESDFQLSHQTLEVLNCKMQRVKQRTRDLATKNLILCYKKQDLEKEAVRYEGLCQIAKFFNQPKESVLADEQGSCAKHVKTSCENAIDECKAQILEFRKLYKMKDVDMETLRTNKRKLLKNVHCLMEDIPILNIWHTILGSIIQVKKICDQPQSHVQKESQQLQCLKENIKSELDKFMKLLVELFAAHHSLQHKLNQSTTACDSLLDRAVELVQEKMSGSVQETGNVKQWLELQIGDTELGVIKETVQEQIKKLKGNKKLSDIDVLTLQEEEMKRRCKEFERLKADIRTNYVWLTKTHEDQIKTEEEVKQAITMLSQMCTLDEHDLTDLDRLVKRLQGAVQQELKEFMAFPLHLLDNITLPSGSVLHSSHQILKCHHNIIDMDYELTDLLTAMKCISSAAPHSIALQILEKKLYLNYMKTTCNSANDLSFSLANLDLNCMKNMENAATTALTEVTNAVKKSIEECKMVVLRAEDNYRAWLEHPVQHAVPEYLQIDDKSFHQWQCEYDSFLTTLADLESEDEALGKM